MAEQTVSLTRVHAERVKKALVDAGDVVVALDWIASQRGEGDMMGALETVKACAQRLDAALGDSFDYVHDALMDAGAANG